MILFSASAQPRFTIIRSENYGQRSCKDRQVTQWRQSLSVGDIQADHFAKRRTILATHLPESRHSRKYLEAPSMPGWVCRRRIRHFWRRSDETHVAEQHVEQLR